MNNLICIDEKKTVSTTELPYIFVTAFDDAAVTAFYKSFFDLQANDKVATIPIVISSYGGAVHALLSMIDVIQSSTKPVATIGLGKAMSCGAVLLAAGTKGYRYAAKHTDIMIHEVSSMAWGTNTELKNNVKQVGRLNNTLFGLLETFSKKDKKYFTEQLKSSGNVDWFMTADEYKKLGLVDHIKVPNLVKK